jgi:hypothetical protein
MPPDEPKSVGRAEMIAEAMLENLQIMNQHMEAAAKRQEVIAESLEDLIDWFNVVDKTMETLTRNNSEGRKLSLADFSKAWELAAEEVFDEDDEPGDEDPLVGAHRD